MKKTVVILFFLAYQFGNSQQVEVLHQNLYVSLRGLSVVNDSVVWVSGNKGSVGKSLNGGKTFQWFTVKGFENTDFRDIEAFDEKTAIIMAVGEPAYVLKTSDGGQNWKKIYENHEKGMFLDAMDFLNDKIGVVVGDPINNKIFLAKTCDSGETWKIVNTKHYPKLNEGEILFASSGSNIKMLTRNKYVYVTGGKTSNLYINKKRCPLFFLPDIESNGANAIAIKDKKTWIIVGGDYLEKINSLFNNLSITYSGGNAFFIPENKTDNYRSGVEYINNNSWIMCGLSGVDLSTNNGKSWQNISQEGFHVCKKAKSGNTVFLAGNGKIGILKYDF